MKELKQTLPNEIPIVIAGNKSDLRKPAIKKEVVNKLVKSMNSTHFEVSAKTGQNVKELFTFLAESIIAIYYYLL